MSRGNPLEDVSPSEPNGVRLTYDDFVQFPDDGRIPELDIVRVYRRTDGTFARPIELSAEAGDVLTTPLLKGLDLPLVDIFRA